MINFFSKLLISKSLSLPSIYFPFFLFLLPFLPPSFPPFLPSFLISLLFSNPPFLDTRYSCSIIPLFLLNVIHPSHSPPFSLNFFVFLFPFPLPPPSLSFSTCTSLISSAPFFTCYTFASLSFLYLFLYLLLPLPFSLFLTHFFSFFSR